MPAAKDSSGDSDDLQALFDSVVEQVGGSAASTAVPGTAGEPVSGQEAAFNRIGHMARQLHDSLRGLGYDDVGIDRLADGKVIALEARAVEPIVY